MNEREKLTKTLKDSIGASHSNCPRFIDSSYSCTVCKYRGSNGRCDSTARVIDELIKRNVVVLPCKVGDTVYTNHHMRGDYLRRKEAPYELRIVFIGINSHEDYGDGYINVKYMKTGNEAQFRFSDFGKDVFLTKEEAEWGRT